MPSSTVIPNIEAEVNELLGEVTQEQLEHEIEIIELQANATQTPLDHDTLISDTFSDADGYENTVNTGNTTLIHDTNKYKTGELATYTVDDDSVTSTTSNISYNCSILKDGYFSKLRGYVSSSSANITVTIKKGSTTIYNEVHSVSSNDYELTLNLSDYTEVFSNGDAATIQMATTYNMHYHSGASHSNAGFSISSQSINANHGASNEIEFINILTTGLVEIDLPTISGNVVATALVINGDDENTNYDITNGVGTDESQIVGGIKNTISNFTGNPTKIKIKLTEANKFVKTFCLKLWKE